MNKNEINKFKDILEKRQEELSEVLTPEFLREKLIIKNLEASCLDSCCQFLSEFPLGARE